MPDTRSRRWQARACGLWLAAAAWAAAAATPAAPPAELETEQVSALVEATLAEVPRFQLELRAAQADAPPLRAGQAGQVRLDITMSGVPAGFDVYAMVVPALEGCLIVERISKKAAPSGSKLRSFSTSFGGLNVSEWATLSDTARQPVVKIDHARVRTLAFTLAGSLGNGALSTLQVGPENFPVHFALPVEMLADMLMSGSRSGQERAALQDYKVQNENFPLLLNFAYLASAGAGRDRQTVTGIPLTLTPPDSRYRYDAVMLIPLLVRRHANGLVVARLDEARANRLSIAAQAPADALAGGCKAAGEDTPAPPEPPEAQGRLQLAASDAPRLQIGREARVNFRIDYADLPRDTELYVLLQTAHGKMVVGQGDGMTTEVSSGSTRLRLCTDPRAQGGLLRIRDEPIVIDGPMIVGRLEAGKLASAHRGGAGSVNGSIAFTPPPLNRFYDRVRATPIALTWSADGRLCTVLDTAGAPGVDLPIEGR